jgi:hypothetical protein
MFLAQCIELFVEFAFGDVNPPVHAWAAWRVYKISGQRGERDREFLESVFQKEGADDFHE